jgi:membrane fusion protein, multidrug efflux system
MTLPAASPTPVAPAAEEPAAPAMPSVPAPRAGRPRVRVALALLALVLAASAGVAAWHLAPTTVSTAPVLRGDAAEIVYAAGVVEPRNWARVTPLVRERIVWLCDCEGQTVAAGDALAQLDDREAQATLGELRARQDLAARELARLRELTARNVATRHDLERAESEEARVEALIAAQQVRLDAYVLRTPIAGVVLRQDGEVGEIAEAGAVLFRIGQPRPLRIVAEVNEEDVPRVSAGQRTLLRADAFPGEALEAVVESVTPMGDPLSRTWRVRFALPDDTPLMIGMNVEVNVVAELREAVLLVPAVALDPDGAVWVVRDGQAERRAVETGIRGAAQVEVTSGLAEGEAVIVPVPEGLTEGARIRTEASP